MESVGDGVSSFPKTHNSASVMGYNLSSISGTSRPTRLPPPKQSRNDGASSASYATVPDHGMKTVLHAVDSVINEKHSHKTAQDHMHLEELHTSSKQLYKSNKDQLNCNSSGLIGPENFVPGPCKGGVVEPNSQLTAQSAISFCASPQNSLYSATQYTEAKQSFTNTEVSECASSVEKSGESAEISNSCDFAESRKTSIYRGSTGSDVSDESSSSSFSSTLYKPHKANDTRWEAIQAVRSRDGVLGLNHFRLLKKLGCGDIGTVYLSELSCTRSYFAMKVMDKGALASRKKLLRAQTEREILQSLDHPFLPTLYTHFETEKFSCLVMEFCPGGDLHALRQRQPGKYFSEHAARFYVAEVLLALEYLHMLGIIYRDLKPENVLVREDGHIMLSDFDLSLRCALIAEPTTARSMSFVGTHEYLAPEIIKGEGHGSAVDWWTFGIFLYELLFGKTPFKGAGNRATLFNVVGQPLRFPESPAVSFAARDLIRGLLVKEPQHRLAYRRGATEVKQHPFFQSVNWALIRCTNPPDMPKPFMIDFSARSVDVKPSGNYLEIDFF
ncbi:unnamed protein product, partial [Vitis vinifera]